MSFDIDNDRSLDRTAWVSPSDGLLVRDLNKDGVINHGGELFGEGTVMADGSKAKDGYVALSALDSNLDGVIDMNDASFGELGVWKDANGNGISDAGEVHSLSSLEVKSLSLTAAVSTEINNGNLIGLMGSYTSVDGQTHTMGDVWFTTDESGNRVFDLAAAVQQAGSSKVNLGGNAKPDTLRVSLSEVLSLGESEIGGVSQVTIDGTAGDTVQLAHGGAGWSAAGSVSENGETYMVYVNANAQLLVNEKIRLIIG